jgi:hypothetical protein
MFSKALQLSVRNGSGPAKRMLTKRVGRIPQTLTPAQMTAQSPLPFLGQPAKIAITIWCYVCPPFWVFPIMMSLNAKKKYG